MQLILRPLETFGPWTWIDPGAFALVGAGAFMSGVTRLTMVRRGEGGEWRIGEVNVDAEREVRWS